MQATEFIEQLVDYTKNVCRSLKIPFDARGRRNWRRWDNGVGPTGAIIHYTASDQAVTKRRPLGRIPVLLRRFARNSGVPGVHFVVWDDFNPKLDKIRAKYSVFDILPCDVFCWGLDVAFYHGNWTNGWAFGIENRNVGVLTKRGRRFFWRRRFPYRGREPRQLNGVWFEPFTNEQISANVMVLWAVFSIYKLSSAFSIVGHTHVMSTKVDPLPSFPFHAVRKMVDALIIDNGKRMHSMEIGGDYTSMCNYVPTVEVNSSWEHFSKDDEPYLNLLSKLGYYVYTDRYALWSVKTFQKRWVRRVGRRWRHWVKPTGCIDGQTRRLIKRMARIWKIK